MRKVAPIHNEAINFSVELNAVVAVVIPCYKVKSHILDVVKSIGVEVSRIYVVDDCCPEGTGKFVEDECSDSRVVVVYNRENLGVGGAVMHGYRQAIKDDMDVIVKIDGDGQMDASMITRMVSPLISGKFDYAKGNRFYDLTRISEMPALRIFGNSVLSVMAKFSSGYWSVFDPANGYTAITAKVARHLPFEKISKRYFFETDMLFRLNILRASVIDIPMHAIYGDEKSNLSEFRILPEFLYKHTKNFFKRIFYNYFLRDMSLATIELSIGLMIFLFGLLFGGYHWVQAIQSSDPTPLGIIMMSALPMLMGLQLILAFLSYDMSSVPREPISDYLPDHLLESEGDSLVSAPEYPRDHVLELEGGDL